MRDGLQFAVREKWSKEELPAWPEEHTKDKWCASNGQHKLQNSCAADSIFEVSKT